MRYFIFALKFHVRCTSYDNMNKVLFLSLVAAAAFLAGSVYFSKNTCVGPYFFESESTLASYVPVQQINEKIAKQDAIIKEIEKSYLDSIVGLFDSTDSNQKPSQDMVDLLNLESNIFVHKKTDSLLTSMQADLAFAMKKFDADVALFCQKKGIPVMFSSNGNSVVYGTNSKADLTKDLTNFFGDGIDE